MHSPAAPLHDRAELKNLNLTTAGAACAVLTTLSFVVGIALMGSSGVQALIPDTGASALDWIKDVDDAGGMFFAGAWLAIIGGGFAIIAFVGFWSALRQASDLMILGPILGAVGMTLVTISHLLPIAMAYELVPGYVVATGATRESLTVTTDTLASLALVLNYTGDVIVWGVVVPLFSWAVLKTNLLPRWIGWLGIITAFFAGWLGAAAPASRQLEDATFIGFVAFFVWMAAMGLALLRRRPRIEELAPASVQ
ncbi:MAG: hypothetical protein M3R26_00130 [Actinomycetota bacterium]|nr:hypothetical protein [Actinomycetota bacterium]MDQ2980722.1 hypothetical protein [Actinomycetota bacterium]